MSALSDPPRDDDVRRGSAQPVLLVDPDVASGAASEALLARAGYQVASESRGDVVLQLVRTMFMRMVVTELYVPCRDGPCVATILRDERRRYPRLRVVALTSHDRPDDRAWALAARCDAVVLKSQAAERLVREVRRFDDHDPDLPASAYRTVDRLDS